MLKILNQDKTEVFDVERTNIFVCGNKILISDKVNIYEGKAACLGIYNDEQEAQDILFRIIETFAAIKNLESNFYCIRMPQKREQKQEEVANIPPEVLDMANKIQEGEMIDGGEQGETGENSKV